MTERPEGRPTEDALLMCKALSAGTLKEYLEWLRKRPKDELIERFLGIIYSRSSSMPILSREEQPQVAVHGVGSDPVENTVARAATKISLLLLIRGESEKLGIWGEIQAQWTEQFVPEVDSMVQIGESIAKQCENKGQESKAARLRENIERIKETNKHYIDS